MVHNAKHKFIIVSVVLTMLTTGLLIGAVATPNWIMYSSTGFKPQFQGLFKACRDGYCVTNAFAADAQGLLGNLGCAQSGGELQDRFNVTAGTLLAAGAITFLVIVGHLLHLTRVSKLSHTAHMAMFWGLMVAFLSSLVGIAIFGGTVNAWWNCGSDYCQPYKITQSSCGVGYAYVFNVIACAAILLSAVGIVTYTKFPHIMFPTNDVILLVMIGEILAVTFIGIGVASPEWIVVVYNYASLGLFQQCTAWDCSHLHDFSTRTGCALQTEAVQSRLSAAAALIIVSAIINALLLTLFVLTWLRICTKLFLTRIRKRIVIMIILVSATLQIIAMILAMNVVESYWYCGVSFCDVHGGFCRHGIAFGLCMASICLTLLLLGTHVFNVYDLCCFEERFASGRQSFSILKVLKATKEPQLGDGKEPTDGDKGAGGRDGSEAHTVQLPAGQWDYDTVSGFYWSEELYLFYDPSTQQFYDPNKDEWFIQDRRTAALMGPSPQPSMTSEMQPRVARLESTGRRTPTV